jgi:hypothetical protein
MRRVIVSAVAGLGLAGCSSFSTDSLTSFSFKPTPPTVSVQIDSIPSGADAKTSPGPGCRTPCSVSVPAENFTVTYTLNRFQPLTVPVQVINIPGDFSTPASTSIDPNPVVGELQPAGPPPKAARKPMRPKKPKPKPAAAAPAASPFPTPAAPAPAPTR